MQLQQILALDVAIPGAVERGGEHHSDGHFLPVSDPHWEDERTVDVVTPVKHDQDDICRRRYPILVQVVRDENEVRALHQHPRELRVHHYAPAGLRVTSVWSYDNQVKQVWVKKKVIKIKKCA